MTSLLRFEEIELGENVFVVEEETFENASLLLKLESEILKPLIEGGADPMEVAFCAMYIRMVACTKAKVGKVPTFEEAKKWPSRLVDIWYEAAKRMNPRWFSFEEKESQEEKKRGEQGGRRKAKGSQ